MFPFNAIPKHIACILHTFHKRKVDFMQLWSFVEIHAFLKKLFCLLHKFNSFRKNMINFLFRLYLIFCAYFPSFVCIFKKCNLWPLLNIVIVAVICKFVFPFPLYLYFYWEVIKYLFLEFPNSDALKRTNTLGMLSTKKRSCTLLLVLDIFSILTMSSANYLIYIFYLLLKSWGLDSCV